MFAQSRDARICNAARRVALSLLWWTAACSDASDSEMSRDRSATTSVDGGGDTVRDGSIAHSEARDGSARAENPPSMLRLRADVEPVTRVEQALEGVFIPPYRECAAPKAGERGKGPDGKVCTNVAISGATEEGKYFPDYGSCAVVITQRPFWSAPPAGKAADDDPRLTDQAYLAELGWVSSQIAATGCVCCHDSKALGKQAAQWDISLGPLWLDTLSNSGLALFAGLADSSVLGAYRPEDNDGFDRNVLGIPTTDNARMKRFMLAELARRGISEEAARAVPPFGGPIYENRVAKPAACRPGEGVADDGRITWLGGSARYVYVMEAESENPGVPPNLDLPAGTLLRLDVLASQAALAPGLSYGATPAGSFQAFPVSTQARTLMKGKTYHLTVLKDVGVPLANCLFEFGTVQMATPAPSDAGRADAGSPTEAGAANQGAACTLAGGDADGFGAPCSDAVNHSDCPCAANYCAIQPGQSQGYCTKSGCTEPTNACPSGWSCFDLSRFAPGQPAICTR